MRALACRLTLNSNRLCRCAPIARSDEALPPIPRPEDSPEVWAAYFARLRMTLETAYRGNAGRAPPTPTAVPADAAPPAEAPASAGSSAHP